MFKQILEISITAYKNNNVKLVSHSHYVHCDSNIPVSFFSTAVENLQILCPYFNAHFFQSIEKSGFFLNICLYYICKSPNQLPSADSIL